MRFLVYMYYTHRSYQISIFGKNYAYYLRIFTVSSFFCKVPQLFAIGPKADSHGLNAVSNVAYAKYSMCVVHSETKNCNI